MLDVEINDKRVSLKIFIYPFESKGYLYKKKIINTSCPMIDL